MTNKQSWEEGNIKKWVEEKDYPAIYNFVNAWIEEEKQKLLTSKSEQMEREKIKPDGVDVNEHDKYVFGFNAGISACIEILKK